MPKLVNIPTLQQLHDNALRFIQSALAEGRAAGEVSSPVARENNRVLSFVVGSAAHGIYQYLRDYIAKQAVPIWAAGEYLEGWLEAYGLKRKLANPAEGTMTVTGVDGSVLVANEAWVLAGVLYLVTADVTIVAGTATASIIAAEGGANGNQIAGVKLALVNPVSGIDAEATVILLERGTDTETDVDAQYRLQQRLANPPLGGAPADYERWALSVDGITRAWGLRNPSGACSAGVIIMADNNGNNGVPSVADQTAVYDYIRDDSRGPGDELFVIIPTAVLVAHTISITPDTPEIRTAIEDELKDLYYREGTPNNNIPHTHLTEAVSVAKGEFTHQFTTPAISAGGELVAGQYDVLVYNGVTFV